MTTPEERAEIRDDALDRLEAVAWMLQEMEMPYISGGLVNILNGIRADICRSCGEVRG